MPVQGTFGYDMDFVNRFFKSVVLSGGDAKVLVSPGLQARVMTSTAGGNSGTSYGWINYSLLESGKMLDHMNPFGGEDRFWVGPEGGQYSVFFKKGDPFDLDHWQTPRALDTEPFEIIAGSQDSLHCRKDVQVENYFGTVLRFTVDRIVRLLPVERLSGFLGTAVPASVKAVCFESENRVTNTGEKAWEKEGGLISVWILGMFNASESMVVAIPFRDHPDLSGTAVVNDAYFGKVPPDRLKIGPGILYFKGDAKLRSKIGLPPERIRPVAGSYDADKKVLTLVQFSFDPEAKDYINSMWEIQKEPYRGDVINSYNDGSLGPTGQGLGAFYELESSSPALALKPGASAVHVHRTMHFEGEEADLDRICRSVLGVRLEDIQNAFN
ncbi:hypothetical protein JW906_05620 [bacterium]|nr:hypothetical protein [bacterium]